MIVNARCSKDSEWGFLESYKVYQYERTGYVKAICSVTMDKTLTPVYVFRGEKFVPIEEIDKEVGLARYIKAKKPFYSKVKGGFLVELKAEVDFVGKVYFPEKSTYKVFTLNSALVGDVSKGLPFREVLNVPKEFEEVVKEPLRLLGESFGDREKFLRSRMRY